ncbi:MAG: peptide-methionine (S)-S-oxide reductase MsrA [Candidatus Micrarchaeaceae archaeon]
MVSKTIYLGAGCFWCTEAVYKLFNGIISTQPGYAGGHTKNPTYKEVCSGNTGHAEVVRVEYDPSILPLRRVLDIYFSMHDPTSKNRQGEDVGEQYRSIILYQEDSDKEIIDKYIEGIRPQYKKPITTEVVKLIEFYPAEEYHKDYYDNNRLNPYCTLVIWPKLRKIMKEFGIKGH